MDSRLAKKFAMDIRRERGSRWDPPFVTQSNPATNADFIQAEIHDSLRGRRMQLTHRGKTWSPPWFTATVPTTVWSPQFTVRRDRVLNLVRRGRISFVGSSPAIAPGTISQGNRRRPPVLRRGKRQEMLSVGADILYGLWKMAPTRARVKPALLRRGRQLPVALADNRLPSNWRQRVRPVLLRRARRSEVVQAQAVVPPPTGPALPQTVRPRIKPALMRRGKHFAPPWVGAALSAFVWYPKQLPRRIRVVGLRPRQAQRREVPVVQMAPVRTTRRVQSRTVRTRRGRRLAFFPAQIIVQVSQWAPGITRARHFQVALRLGRRFNNMRLVRAVTQFAPIKTGQFARGDQGDTDIGQAGDTADPSEGEIL